MTSRLLLVLVGLAFVGCLYLLMLRGWRSRSRRQAFLPAPPVAKDRAATVTGPVAGLFVGTTFAGRWLDRVVVHGLSDRAASWLRIATDGVHVERERLPELFLPFEAIDDAAVGDALAGKVMGPDGLLLLSWRLGDARLTTAFRAGDRAVHGRLVDAIRAQLPVGSSAR